MSRQSAASHFHQSKALHDKYLLGDEIGKGAYGRVYKGLDLENGDFVAIKQVSWENIPAEDLANIMQEIDLLKNLNHKNIVKYLGSFKTKTHLYIILEYVENGSLASIIKPSKFGAFPESLVAVYIAQVLEGLVYLHEQGVIHRDIKGANILTTKEGLVKLADFGVATKLTEADVNTHSVVGTPYWMAPEVIDMSGVSAASDIWSVGCTVIELLTCVPPYYDLQPMPALFRIVQDEHPPIPEHVSPSIIDFLHQCFRKDAKLRPDARTLLNHPWLQNSRRSMTSSLPSTGGPPGPGRAPEEEDGASLVQDLYPVVGVAVKGAQAGPLKTRLELKKEEDSEVTGTLSRADEIAKRVPRVDPTRPPHPLQVRNSEQHHPVGLDKFSDTAADAQFDDLIVESYESALQGSTLEPSSALSSSPSQIAAERGSSASVRGGPDGLAARLKAKMAQKKVQGDSVVAHLRSEEDLLSRINDDPEEDRADMDSLGYEREAEGRDYFAKQALEVTRLIGLLKLDGPEDILLESCQKLVTILGESPEQKTHLIAQHGVIPLMELLDVNNHRVVLAVFQILNEIVKNNVDFQENACLVGLIPVIVNFAGPDVAKEIRMQAAYFVQQLCHTSKLTLQMFIACRGLPVLVGFLETDYVKYRDMVHIAVDGMWKVFELQTSTPRNDFCWIFAKNGVCARLVNSLYSLNELTRVSSASCGVTAEKIRRQSHSGPLEKLHPSFGGMKENGKALSGQLDPARIRAGLEEPYDQPPGVVADTSRLQTAQVQKSSPGQPEYSRHTRGHHHQSLRFSAPAEAPQTGSFGQYQRLFSGTKENSTAESSWAKNEMHSHEKDWSQFPFEQLENNVAKFPQGQSELSKLNVASTDIARPTITSEALQASSGDFLPLLTLLEKEPSSRSLSSQLEHTRHHSGGHGKSDSTGSFLHNQLLSKKFMGEFESLSLNSEAEHNGIPTASKAGWMGTAGVHSLSKASPALSSTRNVVSAEIANGTSGSLSLTEVRSRAGSSASAEVTRDYLSKVADLLLEFSRADSVVKAQLCSGSVLIRLFNLLSKLEPPILLKILKCIKELSMDPCTLEYLQRAEAMKHLVPFLERRGGIHTGQIHNQVLNALFNLCKINKRRQEQAAECGIIPHLMHLILTNSPLKQFALPLLCDMAHASRYTREQLRAHKGLEVYLSLLNDDYWAVTALDSIAVCLAHDNEQRKVEQTLLKKEALQKLVAFFQSCGGAAFVHILEPFLKMISKSVHLNTALALSGLTPLLISRLDHQDAIVRLNLLKLIKAVYEHHPRPKQLIVEYDLPQKLQKLIDERRDGERSGGQVLVKQMATTLLKALHLNTVL